MVIPVVAEPSQPCGTLNVSTSERTGSGVARCDGDMGRRRSGEPEGEQAGGAGGGAEARESTSYVHEFSFVVGRAWIGQAVRNESDRRPTKGYDDERAPQRQHRRIAGDRAQEGRHRHDAGVRPGQHHLDRAPTQLPDHGRDDAAYDVGQDHLPGEVEVGAVHMLRRRGQHRPSSSAAGAAPRPGPGPSPATARGPGGPASRRRIRVRPRRASSRPPGSCPPAQVCAATRTIMISSVASAERRMTPRRGSTWIESTSHILPSRCFRRARGSVSWVSPSPHGCTSSAGGRSAAGRRRASPRTSSCRRTTRTGAVPRSPA